MSDQAKLTPCPFEKVEKDIGHNLYTSDQDGFWCVHCTCGARGSIGATADCAATAWNTSAPPNTGEGS